MRGLGGRRRSGSRSATEHGVGSSAHARSLGPLLLWSALAAAPMQCAGDPDPSTRREETPSEALMELAAEFERAQDRAGQIRTLRFVVDRHPTTRQAHDAYLRLRELGVDVADPAERRGAPLPDARPPTGAGGSPP